MAGLTKEQKAAKMLLAKAIELSGLSAEAFEALGEQERADWSKNAQDAIDLAAAGKPVVEDDEPDYTGLVKVELGGEELYVHPSCLDDHKRLGWNEV